MKTFKAILFLVILSFASITNAQIFKKLGNKVTKTAERTLEKKIEQKTEKETEKVFDSTFNNQNTSKKEKKNANNLTTSNVTPTNTYAFSHRYVMQVKSEKNTTNLIYYLTQSENYIGTAILNKNNEEDVINVMDLEQKTLFMFMENKGDKTQMSMNLDLEEVTDDAMKETAVKISTTGRTKFILGYKCQEFKIVGKHLHGSVWTTQDAGVSFSKSFYNLKTNKGMDQTWLKLIKGLTMQMEMIDTSKRKPQNISMICISLEKSILKIQSKEYKKLM